MTEEMSEEMKPVDNISSFVIPEVIKKRRGRPKGSGKKQGDRCGAGRPFNGTAEPYLEGVIPDDITIDGKVKTEFQKNLEKIHGRKMGRVFQVGHKLRKKGVQPITHKQKTFLKKFAECGVKTEALRKSGYNNLKNTSTANDIIRKHPREFVEIMEEHGLSDDLLVISIKQGLEATKPIINNLGEVVDNIPAMDTRHKYLDTALKVKGKYAPEKILTVQANVNIAAENVKDMSMEQIDAILQGKEVKVGS